jgi:hypothetical protein
MNRPWKQIVRALANVHEQYGAAFVRLEDATPVVAPTSPSDPAIVNILEDGELLKIRGRELSTKKVKQWLWTHRKKRAVTRARGVIWSVYQKGWTTVGLAALTDRRVYEESHNVEFCGAH